MKRDLRTILPARSVGVSILFILICFYLVKTVPGKNPVIQFLGAAGEVGGSCHQVTAGDVSFLVDCGALGKSGTGVLPSYPAGISFVLLTHAHSDHCGLLPQLYSGGFHGDTYCSEATAALVPIMLKMSRGFTRPVIEKSKFDMALDRIVPLPFDSVIVRDRIEFRLRRSEHLLGAAFLEVWIDNGKKLTKIVFSGDLGSGGSALLPPLESCGSADYVVIESTYGGKIRSGDSTGVRRRYGEFARAVGRALKRGGDVLIPAFTLGRTQEVMAVLDFFSAEGDIPPGTLIYVDSPTAKKVTAVYRRFAGEMSERARKFYGDRFLDSPGLREVSSSTSLKVHSRHHVPTIFISSSGDLDHANSPVHLMRMYADSLNLLCLVGWQPPGSVGGRLAAGEDTVLVTYRDGKKYSKAWIEPSIEVRRFESFSGHADQKGLISWLAGIAGVKKVFIVHGEPDQSELLAQRIRDELNIDTEIPCPGERFILKNSESRMESRAGIGLPVTGGMD